MVEFDKAIRNARSAGEGYAIVQYWTTDDVLAVDHSLSQEEAWGVLQKVEAKWSASIGINWTAIQEFIAEYKAGV